VKSITIDGWEYPFHVETTDSPGHLCDVVFDYADNASEFVVTTASAQGLKLHLKTTARSELPKLKRHRVRPQLRLVV
jgi:hypothetical protein